MSTTSLGNNEHPIAKPFDGLDLQKMKEKVEDFRNKTGLTEDDVSLRLLRRGAFLAQHGEYREANPYEQTEESLDSTVHVTVEEAEYLRMEAEKVTPFNFFRMLMAHSKTTYGVIACCSIGAVVQGWDETAVNGAQVFYSTRFGIAGEDLGSKGRLGFVNAAPYLICAFACLLNSPLNHVLQGRRGVIFLTCLISFGSCLGQAFVDSWPHLVLARLFLGLGIGPKSATIPIYAAECAPAKLRGGLVMLWQLWTAFGIMVGYIFGVIFWNRLGNSNWRWMLGLPMAPPLFLVVFVWFLPESPRFLLQKAQHCPDTDMRKRRKYTLAAFKALEKFNKTKLQASRELISIYYSLDAEPKDHWLETIKKLWTNKRSRHALLASVTVMFLQQFCGVNVLAYYSTPVLRETFKGHGDTDPQARLEANRKAFEYSLGFGVINFALAWVALPLMDTVGRRGLLLTTFPLLAAFQFMMAGVTSFEATVTAMYMFCVVYSVGEGPVPFVYASESMPLYHRDYGMGIATSVTWLFNFVLAISWPTFEYAFKRVGAFSWYGGWCVVGWIMIFCLVRETKGLKLEDMHEVFSCPPNVYVDFAMIELKWVVRGALHLSWGPAPRLQDTDMYRAWKDSQGQEMRDVSQQSEAHS